MAITPAEFRTNFPEFANSTQFPDSMLMFWLGAAYLQLNALVWLDLLDLGAQLYVAHKVYLAAQNNATATANNASANIGLAPGPGQATGVVSNKSVDKVSISYDSSKVSYEGAGQWNLTTYGLQYWELLQIVGAGEIVTIAPSNCGEQFGWQNWS